jgi:hypothetical protein
MRRDMKPKTFPNTNSSTDIAIASENVMPAITASAVINSCIVLLLCCGALRREICREDTNWQLAEKKVVRAHKEKVFVFFDIQSCQNKDKKQGPSKIAANYY